MPHEVTQQWKLRHSSEHLLTMAMQLLYGPEKVVMAMGPATDDGFYFDFEPRDFAMTEDLFPEIEKKMRGLIKQDLLFTRIVVSPEIAEKLFAQNPYKQEWIAEAAGRGEELSLYITCRTEKLEEAKNMIAQGILPNLQETQIFVDLCSGPHVERSSEVGAFALLKLAGAYWRGDEKNQMLTRVYGTAFATQKELDAYLEFLEEAKRRDHRRLGKELDLFTFSELVGAGLPLWTPKGTILRTILDTFVWKLREQAGYSRVEIPHITKKELYITSGHWDKFKDELFRIKTREGHEFAMKPMNCPHHTQIFARRPHSYREMPQRYANTTMVYRDEQTGELSGLSRVRSITQDDAHVFCRPSQVKEEMLKIWDIIQTFYSAAGFDLRIRLSLHDPEHPEKYLGSQDRWHQAEQEIRELVQAQGVEFTEAPGEAAFYGPKIDFMTSDALGREWQVATIQLDMNMPERFNLFCINEEGQEEQVVMIHAAIMGAIERFLSTLIEHCAGAFPVWMAPVQVAIVPIAEAHQLYAEELVAFFREQGVRVELRAESETMQNRIRKAEQEKIPYILVVGGKEEQQHRDNTVEFASAVRGRGNENLGVQSGAELVKRIKNDTPDVLK